MLNLVQIKAKSDENGLLEEMLALDPRDEMDKPLPIVFASVMAAVS